jgi:hypothetical protein
MSNETEFEKYRGKLYAELTLEEKAFHDALVYIAEQYGPFDIGTSSIWVGYKNESENEDVEIGVKCSNCSMFNPENNGCAILSYSVHPNAICRLAAIPDGYVSVNEEKFVEVEKAGSVSVGSMVSWNSSGGRASGKVKRIIRNGRYKVPNSDFTITGTEDNPAVVIELYRNNKPTGRMVGHRMNSLSVSKDTSSTWSGAFSDISMIFNKRDYSQETRRRMAESGQAMADGSYPIANRADLQRAIQAVGRAKNYAAAKRHIIKRARQLGATDMLPEDWK